jgi:hypothetical protein
MRNHLPLLALWLPVILSTVAVFLIGGCAWLDLPHHRSHLQRLPDESAERSLLRGLEPGRYRIPHSAGATDLRDRAFRQRYEEGPVGTLTLERQGRVGVGRRLGFTLAWHLVITCTTAWLLGRSWGLYPWAGMPVPAMDVFVMASGLTFGFHAFGLFPEAIWFSKPWRRIGWDVVDSGLYAFVTGGIFMLCWPPSGCIG